MSDKTILGVDIGTQGALASLSERGALIGVEDMPILRDGPAKRPTVNAPLLTAIVECWRPSRAFIEFVGARPGEGPAGASAFGRSRGIVEGVLGACAVSTTHIARAAWKRAVGIPPGREGAKDFARSEAIRRWPAHASQFARFKDGGRAEACLIAVAGMKKERRE